jgi:hypothetical protein
MKRSEQPGLSLPKNQDPDWVLDRKRPRRPLLLWLSALWLVGLGGADLWRGVTLWQMRHLLAALGSSLSPFVSAFLATGWALSASALLPAAVGLWLRHEWARHTARAALVAHFSLTQVYTWAFVRTGLLWERRWSTLALGLLATGLGLAALTWPLSRRWLGLRTTRKPSTMT